MKIKMSHTVEIKRTESEETDQGIRTKYYNLPLKDLKSVTNNCYIINYLITF